MHLAPAMCETTKRARDHRGAPSPINETYGNKEDASMRMAVRFKLMRLSICVASLAMLANVPMATAAEYDSGWAVSPPAVVAPDGGESPSLLDSPRVPVDQLLTPGLIQRLVVPNIAVPAAQKPAAGQDQDPSLKWRPRRTASRPDAWRAPPTGEASGLSERLDGPHQGRLDDAFALPGMDATAAPAENDARRPAISPPAVGISPNADDSPSVKSLPSVERSPGVDSSSSDASSPSADGTSTIREPAPFPPPATQPNEIELPVPDAGAKGQSSAAAQPDRSIKPPRTAKRPTPQPAEKSPADDQPQAAGPETAGPKTGESETGKPEKPAVKPNSASDIPTKTVEAKPTPKKQTVKTGPFKSAITAKPAATALKPLTRNQQNLRRRLRSVLSYYYRRPLNSRDHDPWELMHGMLSYGLHSRVLDGGPRSKPVTAVGHLCFNKPCKRKRLMHLTPDGLLDAEVAYGLQGHKGQLLAMLAQCNVSLQYPIRVEGKQFTIEDLIAAEQRTCYADTELTFKLIALMHYTDSDTKWVNDQGESWDIPRLINEERHQKIRGAACGGTHRLSGLALAARTRVLRGEPLDGEYLEAQRVTDERIKYAFRLQNRDGSLSTEWFRGPGAEEDINRRVRTTGHLLEWLLYALPDERLTDYRTVRAVTYLTNLLTQNTDNPWEVGPLSHALHALMLYDQRVFQPHDAPPQLAAKTDQASKQQRASNSPNRRRQATQQAMNYQNINSRFYGSYPSAEQIEAAREAEKSGGGLRALFGIGSANKRRSR